MARSHATAASADAHVTAGFAAMTSLLLQLADGRVLLVLEGGYDLHSLSSAAVACLRVLMGENPPPLPLELPTAADGPAAMQHGPSPLPEACRVLHEVIDVQQRFWPILRAARSPSAQRPHAASEAPAAAAAPPPPPTSSTGTDAVDMATVAEHTGDAAGTAIEPCCCSAVPAAAATASDASSVPVNGAVQPCVAPVPPCCHFPVPWHWYSARASAEPGATGPERARDALVAGMDRSGDAGLMAFDSVAGQRSADSVASSSASTRTRHSVGRPLRYRDIATS